MAFAAVCQAIAGLLAWNLTQNIDIYGYLSGYSRAFSRHFVYERRNERRCRWFCLEFGVKMTEFQAKCTSQAKVDT